MRSKADTRSLTRKHIDTKLHQPSPSFTDRFYTDIVPDMVLPFQVERAYNSLTNVTATHATLSAFETLANIVHPLLQRNNYPAGAACLLDLMVCTHTAQHSSAQHTTTPHHTTPHTYIHKHKHQTQYRHTCTRTFA